MKLLQSYSKNLIWEVVTLLLSSAVQRDDVLFDAILLNDSIHSMHYLQLEYYIWKQN